MILYIFRNNQQLGPFDESYVRDALRSGTFSANDLACPEGSTEWLPLSTFFPAETETRGDNPQSSPYSWANPQPGQSAPGYQQTPGYEQQAGSNYYQTPPQPMTYQPVTANPYGLPPQSTSSLPVVGMSLGIFVLCLMLVGLIPCLGWLNWFVLTLAVVTNVICLISILSEKDLNARNKAIIGFVLAFVAIFVGGFRLALGGGCL
jgi:hypothetical protein